MHTVARGQLQAQPGWQFWAVWVLASMAGVVVFSIVSLVLNVVLQRVALHDPPVLFALIAGSSGILGAALGIGQWLVLRQYLRGTGWWVLATLIGYAVPLALSGTVPRQQPPWVMAITMALLFGTILGVSQWLVLRGKLCLAGWWIVISIVAWAVAFALPGLAYVSGVYVEPFDLLSAFLVPVAAGGAGMVWLLRREGSRLQGAGTLSLTQE